MGFEIGLGFEVRVFNLTFKNHLLLFRSAVALPMPIFAPCRSPACRVRVIALAFRGIRAEPVPGAFSLVGLELRRARWENEVAYALVLVMKHIETLIVFLAPSLHFLGPTVAPGPVPGALLETLS